MVFEFSAGGCSDRSDRSGRSDRIKERMNKASQTSDRRPAVFLDRDGTIVEDRGDLRSPGQVRFLPGVFPALRELARHFALLIVTNQGGVGRGTLAMDEVAAVNDHVAQCLCEQGVELLATYVCPHRRDENCRCAKPSPYFLHRAAADFNLDLAASFVVGDHPHDAATATAAGAVGIYVLTGHGVRHLDQLTRSDGQVVVDDLPGAARVMMAESSARRSPPPADELTLAARCLQRGGLVALPTETVYGLGANAFDPRAVAAIFAVKQRPRFDPLIVHVPDISWLDRLATEVNPLAQRLAEAFWPGPLTLVLPRRETIPDLVVAGLPTVALRVPSHPLALTLLQRTGLPLAAPSANRFGGVSPTCAAHVREGLGQMVDMVLDGGDCGVGVESTIVGFGDDGRPVLLRPGGVALERLDAVAGMAIARPGEGKGGEVAATVVAPGMLRRHYSPGTPVRLFEAGGKLPTAAADELAGLLLLAPRPDCETASFAVVETLSANGDLDEAARNLFAALRRLDASAATAIAAELAPEQGLGRAINDRLRRAAAW